MDFTCQKQTVMLPRPAMNMHEEYVLSGDFVLPEYCPDVAVVLKCQITPYVASRQWNGDQLVLDGTALLRVLYLDEERQCVREAEFTQPISCSLRGDGDAQGAMVQLSLTPEYVNCRATSPRRLEVRGAFTIHAWALKTQEMVLLDSQQEEGLYMQTATMQINAPKAWAERMTVVSEILDFTGDLPEAEQLLGGHCQAVVQECKLLSGKAIVKGQLYMHQLYTDDSSRGTTHVLDYTLPFSQILDVDGAMDGDLATAEVLLLSDTQRTALNDAGQNGALELTAKLLIQVQVYSSEEIRLVTDAYHGRCPVEPHTCMVSPYSLVGVQRQNTTVQKSVELPTSELKEILDIWVQPLAMPAECREGKALLAGRLLICMLVRQEDGTVAYYERPEEFQLEYPAQGDSAEAHYCVMGVQYTASDSRLDMRISLCINMTLWQQGAVEVMENLTMQEGMAYPPERAAIKLYFAEKGERVWDIARECHASPEALRQENALHEDVLSQEMALLVPIV